MEDNNSQTVTGTAKGVFSKGRLPKKRIVRFVGLGLLGVLIIAVVSGFIAITFKMPNQKVVLFSQVCDEDTVSNYNTAARESYGDTPESGMVALDSLSLDISKRPGYDGDPTCVFIRYRVAVMRKDYATAQSAFDTYVKLVDSSLFANGQLEGLSSVKQMETALGFIKPIQETEFDD